MSVFSDDFITAITAFGDRALVEQIVKAVGPAAMAAGVFTADILDRMMKGTPLQPFTEALTHRPLSPTSNSQG